MTITWNLSDASFLHAVIFANGKKNSAASLRDIISCGDYIDRSIFNYEEAQSALDKLCSSGLLNFDGAKVSMTAALIRKYKSIKKPFRDLVRHSGQILDLLRTNFPEIPKSKKALIAITHEQWRAAVDNYLTSGPS